MTNTPKHRRPQETPAKAVAESDTLPGDPPSNDEIAALAYSYWEARGYQGGTAEEDWLRAEEELRKPRTQLRMRKRATCRGKGCWRLMLKARAGRMEVAVSSTL